MYRRIATTLTATAILAGPAATAQADLGITPIQANTATMVQSIQSQLTGKAFGWEFAIAQNGQLSRTSAGVPAGFAASAADTGGTNVGSQPTRRMQIMSATKTFTAISKLMLLRANNLTVDSPVAPYLPSSWIRGAGFSRMTKIRSASATCFRTPRASLRSSPPWATAIRAATAGTC